MVTSTKGFSIDTEDAETKNSISEYCKELCSEIQNYALRISKKSKQIRYNTTTMRTAMAFWLQCPSVYERMSKTATFTYPSPRTLYNLQKQLITHEGNCACLYGWIQDELSSSMKPDNQMYEENIVMLMFDEMCLRKTLLKANVKDGTVMGFCADDNHDTIHLASEVKKLVDPNEETTDTTDEPKVKEFYDDEIHVAKKVNLFRMRSINGKADNLEYFMNNGSLTGDDLLKQLLRVILLCEVIGHHVAAIVADAGGANASIFNSLRTQQDDFANGLDITEEMVSFAHPFCAGKRIAIVPCTAHGQKALRNSLLSSTLTSTLNPNSPRCFEFHNTFFGWDNMVGWYNEDKGNCPQKTMLRLHNIQPDGYTKMCVKGSVAPFSEQTIVFAIHSLGNDIPGFDSTKFVRDEVITNLGGNKSAYSKGYEPEKYERCLEILEEELRNHVENPKFPEWYSKFLTMKYMVAVFSIYTTRFLNPEAVLVKKLKEGQKRLYNKKGKSLILLPLDEELKKMKKRLSFFEEWRIYAEEQKDAGDTEWGKKFLATITYRNLRTTVVGFFLYAKMILDDAENDHWYVTLSHGSQSSIENVFSQLRGMNRDTADAVGKGLLASKANKMMDTSQMKKGGCYDDALVTASEETVNPRNIFKRRDDLRQNKLDSWKKQNGDKKQSTLKIDMVNEFTKSQEEKRKKMKKSVPILVWTILWNDKLETHFSSWLSSDEDFTEITKTAIYGKTEKVFKNIVCGCDEKKEQKFDQFCQTITTKLAGIFDTMLCTKGKQKIGMYLKIVRYLHTKEYQNTVQSLPDDYRCEIAMGVVVLTISRKIVEKVEAYRKAMMAKAIQQNVQTTVCREKAMRLVNRFIGFGVARLIHDLYDDLNEAKKKKSTEAQDTIFRNLVVAKRLRIFKEQALLIEGYLENYCDHDQALINNGYMAWISPEYFMFGVLCMEKIMEAFHDNIFTKHGNKCLEVAKENLWKYKDELEQCYNTCSQKKQKQYDNWIDDEENENGNRDNAQEVANINDDIDISDAEKSEIVTTVVTKAAHAYYRSQQDIFQQDTVRRKGKDHVQGALRPHLSSLTEKTVMFDIMPAAKKAD